MRLRGLWPTRRASNHAGSQALKHPDELRPRPALLASIVLRHLLQGRAKAVQSGWRLLPPTPRRLLAQVLRPALPTVAAIGDHTLGDRAAARARLRGLTESRRLRRFAVEAATACGELELARAAVTRGAAGGRDLPATTVAGMLRVEGHLTAAREVVVGQRGPGARLLRSAIDGDLAALQPERRPLRRRTASTGARSARTSGGPRVLHVVSSALPEVQAGYTLRTAGIVTAQRRLGMEPHVVTRPGFPADVGGLALRDVVEVDGVPHHRLLPGVMPLRRDRVLEQGTEMLTDLARRLSPDVIHAHSRHDNAQLALTVARRLGVPVVYEVRGMLEETWRSRGGDPVSEHYRLTRAAETWCMQQADRVLTLGHVMAAEIVARGVAPEQVVVTGNAVGTDFLSAGSPAGAAAGVATGHRAAARRALGLGPSALVLGSVSTLNDYEGLDVLVHAAAATGLRDLVLLVVGDGPARHGLERLAEQRGVRAVFTGRVPHHRVPAHLAAMDLFCVPRRPSAVTALVSPLKPVEAMATGLPLLVSDLPALTELLGGQGPLGGRTHGWSAPGGDVMAWTLTIQRVARRRDELLSRGSAARDWVVRERTWEQVGRRQLEVYAALGAVPDAGR